MAGFGTAARSLFHTLFGSGSASSAPQQPGGAPVQGVFGKGDIITFAFLPQPELSNRRYEITAVAAYEDNSGGAAEYTLKGEDGSVFFLSSESEDGEEFIYVSRKLKRGEVLDTFGERDIAAVFEEGFAKLQPSAVPAEHLRAWLGESYHETSDCVKLRYYENGVVSGQGDTLDYYALEDGTEMFAVEIEVYDGGETEIYLTVCHPKSAIAEHWPAGR